jgi:hypothetical protein
VGDNKLLTGKIRIPKSEIQRKLGTGFWNSAVAYMINPLYGRESTE